HLHHAEEVWREEDAKLWRERPSSLADESGLPWRRILAPSLLDAPARLLADEAARASHQSLLFVTFPSEELGRRFAGELERCPGPRVVLEGESAGLARERFRPQQTKRLGPGLLAAEILLPAARVDGFLAAAEPLARRAGRELDAEVYWLADGQALAIA